MIPIDFIGKLSPPRPPHKDSLLWQVVYYTVLTSGTGIYNYTEFNSAVHRNKLHPIKEPL